MSARVHSREQAPFGPTLPGVERVPPSWFLTTSTVCSVRGLAGLLRPAAGQGFVAFRPPAEPVPPYRESKLSRETVADLRVTSPRRGFTPFEEFPSSAAGATSLWPVALLPLPAWSGHRPGRSRCGSRSRRTGNRGAPRTSRPRRDDRAVGSLAPARVPSTLKLWSARGRSSTSTTRAAAPANRCLGEQTATRAAAEATCGERGRSRMGRHAHPAPEARLRGDARKRRHPTVRGRNRGRPRHARAAEAARADLSRPCEAADYRALLRRRVRCVVAPLPAPRHPILPWALSLSKVHSPSAPARPNAGAGQAPRGRSRSTPATRDRGLSPIERAAGIPPSVAPRHPAEAG
jgi:hypothetical protein